MTQENLIFQITNLTRVNGKIEDFLLHTLSNRLIVMVCLGICCGYAHLTALFSLFTVIETTYIIKLYTQ